MRKSYLRLDVRGKVPDGPAIFRQNWVFTFLWDPNSDQRRLDLRGGANPNFLQNNLLEDACGWRNICCTHPPASCLLNSSLSHGSIDSAASQCSTHLPKRKMGSCRCCGGLVFLRGFGPGVCARAPATPFCSPRLPSLLSISPLQQNNLKRVQRVQQMYSTSQTPSRPSVCV